MPHKRAETLVQSRAHAILCLRPMIEPALILCGLRSGMAKDNSQTRPSHVVEILEATAGGTRTHILQLLPGLKKLGFEMTLVASTERNPSFRKDMELVMKVFPLYIFLMERLGRLIQPISGSYWVCFLSATSPWWRALRTSIRMLEAPSKSRKRISTPNRFTSIMMDASRIDRMILFAIFPFAPQRPLGPGIPAVGSFFNEPSIHQRSSSRLDSDSDSPTLNLLATSACAEPKVQGESPQRFGKTSDRLSCTSLTCRHMRGYSTLNCSSRAEISDNRKFPKSNLRCGALISLHSGREAGFETQAQQIQCEILFGVLDYGRSQRDCP